MANSMSYYPNLFKTIREYKTIADIEDFELNRLDACFIDLMDNQFVVSMNEAGCARMEKILSIRKQDTDTLLERRFRILSVLNSQLPYSYRSIEKQIRSLCGEDNFSIVLDKEHYKLVVRVALTAKKNVQAVSKSLDEILPCNLQIEVSLLYNTHGVLAGKAYGELVSYTYRQLREEVL